MEGQTRELERRHGPGGLWAVALLALVCAQLVTCAGPGVQARQAVVAQDGGVSLAWASTDYALHEPEGAVVRLDVIVRNTTDDVTQATSIEWERPFADAYEVLESEPPAWRVHRSEDGWGVLDTSGVPPGEDGHFRIWFARAAASMTGLGEDLNGPPGSAAHTVEAPRIRVVVDGHRLAGEGVATPTYAAERAKLATQLVFERGGLALISDHAALVPNTGAAVFPTVVAFAVVLTVCTAVGLAATVSAIARGL